MVVAITLTPSISVAPYSSRVYCSCYGSDDEESCSTSSEEDQPLPPPPLSSATTSLTKSVSFVPPKTTTTTTTTTTATSMDTYVSSTEGPTVRTTVIRAGYSASGEFRAITVSARVTEYPTNFGDAGKKSPSGSYLPPNILQMSWQNLYYNLLTYLEMCPCTSVRVIPRILDGEPPSIELHGLDNKEGHCRHEIKRRAIVIGSLFYPLPVSFSIYDDDVVVLSTPNGPLDGTGQGILALNCAEQLSGSPLCTDLAFLYNRANCPAQVKGASTF